MRDESGTFDGEKARKRGRNVTKVALIQSGDGRNCLAGLEKLLVVFGIRCTYPF